MMGQSTELRDERICASVPGYVRTNVIEAFRVGQFNSREVFPTRGLQGA